MKKITCNLDKVRRIIETEKKIYQKANIYEVKEKNYEHEMMNESAMPSYQTMKTQVFLIPNKGQDQLFQSNLWIQMNIRQAVRQSF